jgi:hypothetical protein
MFNIEILFYSVISLYYQVPRPIYCNGHKDKNKNVKSRTSLSKELNSRLNNC